MMGRRWWQTAGTWRQLDRWRVLEGFLGRGHSYTGEAHGGDARGTWNAYVDIRVDIGQPRPEASTSNLLKEVVGSTELESVTSCVSSRRSNQLSYEPIQ